MEEKINHLIKERAPWLAKKNFISLLIFNFLKKLLRFDETIYAGDYIQDLSGAEAFNWLDINTPTTALLRVWKIYQVMEVAFL